MKKKSSQKPSSRNYERFKIYTSFESFTADLKMIVKFIIWTLIFSMLVFSLFSYGSLRLIQADFSKQKVPGTVFTKYLAYKHLLFHFDSLNLEFSVENVFRNNGNRVPEKLSMKNYYHLLRSLPDSFNKFLYREELKYYRFLKGSCYISILFSIVFFFFFVFRSREMHKTEHLRGSDIIDSEEFEKRLKNQDRENPLSFYASGIFMPQEAENQHTMIVGASGSGKTVLLHEILRKLFERRQKSGMRETIVCYSPKADDAQKFRNYGWYHLLKERIQGQSTLEVKKIPSPCVLERPNYLSDRYPDQPGDLILCPFHRDSVNWTFFNEFLRDGELDLYAVRNVSLQLFSPPKQDTDNEYWYNAAAHVFETGVYFLYQRYKLLKEKRVISNLSLITFFSQSVEEIKRLFTILPEHLQGAIQHLNAPHQAAGVMGIVQKTLSFLNYLIDRDGDFSLRDFVRKEDTRTLFIINLDSYQEVFKSILTFAVNAIIQEFLSLKDSESRRFHLVIDELGSLYKLPALIRFFIAARSRGGCGWVALQDFGLFKDTYGKDIYETVINNFNRVIIFHLNGHDVTEQMSKFLGDQQYLRQMSNSSMSPKDLGDRKQLNSQDSREPTVLPAEFQALKKHECYIYMCDVGITKMRLNPNFIQAVKPHFVFKPLELLNLDPTDIKRLFGTQGKKSKVLTSPENLTLPLPLDKNIILTHRF